MNRAYGFVLAGAVLAVLGANLACGSKREYTPTPINPTSTSAPTPTNAPTVTLAASTSVPLEPTESIDEMVTPIPEPTYTLTPIIPTPKPELTPTPELTFTENALKSLQEYHDKNPLEVYSSQSLDRMLSFIGTNESLVSDYDARNFHILTTFLTDNPDAVQHATAVDQYVREIDDMIFDYCGLEEDSDTLNKKIEGYAGVPFEAEGEEPTIRDMINLNWSNFMEAEEKGELINSIDSGEMSFLPYAIFTLDMEQRKDAENVNTRYNGNLTENRPNLPEVALKNIRYFQQKHDETWYIATHLDEPLKSEVRTYTPEFIILNNLEGMSSKGWLNSAEQAGKDVKELLEKGDYDTRVWITVYANARLQNRGHDEDAVEGGIAGLWTIGMSAYRTVAQYPLGMGPFHGELAGPLTQGDINLLNGIYDGELLVEPRTQSITTLWTRKDKVIEDETPNLRVLMPNSDQHYFFGPINNSR